MPLEILAMALILKLQPILNPTPRTKQRVFYFLWVKWMHSTGEMHSFHSALKKYTHRRNSTMPQNTSLIIRIIHFKIILSRDFLRKYFLPLLYMYEIYPQKVQLLPYFSRHSWHICSIQTDFIRKKGNYLSRPGVGGVDCEARRSGSLSATRNE